MMDSTVIRIGDRPFERCCAVVLRIVRAFESDSSRLVKVHRQVVGGCIVPQHYAIWALWNIFIHSFIHSSIHSFIHSFILFVSDSLADRKKIQLQKHRNTKKKPKLKTKEHERTILFTTVLNWQLTLLLWHYATASQLGRWNNIRVALSYFISKESLHTFVVTRSKFLMHLNIIITPCIIQCDKIKDNTI